MQTPSTLVIGAGPAGLSAAYELVQHGWKPLVVEQSDLVGGISRTESYKGNRFDIGGHRFFTKVEEIEQLWRKVGGHQFRKVKRRSRIYFDGHFFPYPLQFLPTLRQLGLWRSLDIVISYLKAKITPYKVEETFEHWTVNRFGRRLFEMFFRTYTEKVWGIPTNEIGADWAAQRIQGLSLSTAVIGALFPFKDGSIKTLIEEFDYPVLGPGLMWELFTDEVVRGGGEVRKNIGVTRLDHDGRRVTAVQLQGSSGAETLTPDQVISTMPLRTLIQSLNPAPPPAVLEAASNLQYRDFIIVVLMVDHPAVFNDNWLYIHAPEVKVGRIQNFKNWSMDMVADPSGTTLGMEYFCSLGDSLWSMTDEELIALATKELGQLQFVPGLKVEDATVIRQPKAYPVYDRSYRDNLAVIKSYLATLTNLQTIGRNGLHRYNNQDHSMLTGLYAARNLLGESHDVWEVNTERSYHETFMASEKTRKTGTRVIDEISDF